MPVRDDENELTKDKKTHDTQRTTRTTRNARHDTKRTSRRESMFTRSAAFYITPHGLHLKNTSCEAGLKEVFEHG
jgi:IS1 family transposase